MISKLSVLALEAGKAILQHEPEKLQTKSDHSPLTAADLAANQIIVEGLKKLFPDIPLISEELPLPPYERRKGWERFFIIDPLDGTKEFLKGNGEYTVNIALIENNYPSMGVVYCPPSDCLYAGSPEGAFRTQGNQTPQAIRVQTETPDALRVALSRSHPDSQTQRLLSILETHYSQIHQMKKGSSLKFCLIAEAEADLYPRLASLSEWDSAAAQAVVEAAGGRIWVTQDHSRLSYNKPTLRNPSFMVSSPELENDLKKIKLPPEILTHSD